MSLLNISTKQIVSKEVVFGVSGGFRGEAGTDFAGVESTKITILADSLSKNWHGKTTVDQTLRDASVGEFLASKTFPALCNIYYERVAGSEKKINGGVQTNKDVEKLVVTKIDYINPIDIIELKTAKAA